jgi:hypothetical protein
MLTEKIVYVNLLMHIFALISLLTNQVWCRLN